MENEIVEFTVSRAEVCFYLATFAIGAVTGVGRVWFSDQRASYRRISGVAIVGGFGAFMVCGFAVFVSAGLRRNPWPLLGIAAGSGLTGEAMIEPIFRRAMGQFGLLKERPENDDSSA